MTADFTSSIHIWLIQVAAYMITQMIVTAIRLPTYQTTMIMSVRMSVFMSAEAREVTKSETTPLTFVRSLATVDMEVVTKGRQLCKRFPASLAFVESFACNIRLGSEVIKLFNA